MTPASQLHHTELACTSFFTFSLNYTAGLSSLDHDNRLQANKLLASMMSKTTTETVGAFKPFSLAKLLFSYCVPQKGK